MVAIILLHHFNSWVMPVLFRIWQICFDKEETIWFRCPSSNSPIFCIELTEISSTLYLQLHLTFPILCLHLKVNGTIILYLSIQFFGRHLRYPCGWFSVHQSFSITTSNSR